MPPKNLIPKKGIPARFGLPEGSGTIIRIVLWVAIIQGFDCGGCLGTGAVKGGFLGPIASYGSIRSICVL